MVATEDFLTSLKNYIAGYHISQEYLIAAGGGAIVAFWAAETYHHPIYFTGYLVLAVFAPYAYSLFREIINHIVKGTEYTNGSVENMVAFMTDYPKTSIAYIGFTMTMIVAAFATSHGVSSTQVGWMLLIGMLATASFIMFYFLMSLLQMFMPLLKVVLKMLDTIEAMLKVVDKLLQAVVKVVDSITSVLKTFASIINNVMGMFSHIGL